MTDYPMTPQSIAKARDTQLRERHTVVDETGLAFIDAADRRTR